MDHDQLARSGPGSQGTEGGRGRRTVGPATGGLRGRWGNLVAAAVLAAMALAGIVTGIVSGLDSPAASTGAPGPSSRSVVLTAVDSTVGAKTADVHLTLQLSVPGGGSVTATGDGQVDFTAGSSSLAVDYRGTALPAPGTLTVVYVGGSAYLSLPLVSQFAPGRSWVGAAVGGSELLTGGADPAALFVIDLVAAADRQPARHCRLALGKEAAPGGVGDSGSGGGGGETFHWRNPTSESVGPSSRVSPCSQPRVAPAGSSDRNPAPGSSPGQSHRPPSRPRPTAAAPRPSRP